MITLARPNNDTKRYYGYIYNKDAIVIYLENQLSIHFSPLYWQNKSFVFTIRSSLKIIAISPINYSVYHGEICVYSECPK